jgi:hypothetical protein
MGEEAGAEYLQYAGLCPHLIMWCKRHNGVTQMWYGLRIGNEAPLVEAQDKTRKIISDDKSFWGIGKKAIGL